MKTFTIDNDNNISAFATQEEAAAATANPVDTFASQQELAKLAAAWPTEWATWFLLAVMFGPAVSLSASFNLALPRSMFRRLCGSRGTAIWHGLLPTYYHTPDKRGDVACPVTAGRDSA